MKRRQYKMERVNREMMRDYRKELMRLRINKPTPQELRREYHKANNMYRNMVLESDPGSPYKAGIGQYYVKKEACKTYAAEVGIDLAAEDPPVDPAAMMEV